MKRRVARVASTVAAVGAMALVAGCGPAAVSGGAGGGTGGGLGTPSAPAPSSQSQGGGQSGSTGKTSASAGHAGGSSATTGTALTAVDVNGVAANVPTEWTRTAIGGTGDWGGYRYENPRDSNEYVQVVSSGCVGCYTNAAGNSDPRLVIPQANATDVTVSHDGRTATYQAAGKAQGYLVQGVVTVSANGGGYGYVEMQAPSSASALVAQVLASFHASL